MKRKMLVRMICVIALLGNIVSVFAQEKKPRVEGSTHVFVGEPGQIGSFGPQGDNTFLFVSSEMMLDGKLVKGAPYSAQAINESVQTLANGNHIVRQSTSLVYRDSEGRTRREQTITSLGGVAVAGEPARTTFINDPVAGAYYILDAKNRNARRFDVSAKIAAEKQMVDVMKQKAEAMKAKVPPGDAVAVDKLHEEIAVQRTGEMKIELRGGALAAPKLAGPGMVMMKGDPKNTKKESLGKQIIEGVEAEGTRFTTTIPAGEIGNEQTIESFFESWFSPELQTVIMSKQSDPRTGENTYRLTNINRAEQPGSLFEVPADYTIQEAGPSPEMRYKIDREIRRPGESKEKQQ